MKKLALLTLIISLVLSTVTFAGLQRQIWDNTATGTLDEAWAVINGDTPPTSTDVIGVAAIGDRGVDNYVQHLTGYLVVPADGDYIFHITSDDDSQLLLDGVMVASVSGWTGAQDWASASSIPSEPMALTAGQIVTVEAAHREGTGGDNLAIGWQVPGSSSVVALPDSVTYPAGDVAVSPSPANGATKVIDGMLSWSAPLMVDAPVYELYIGTDPDALAETVEGLTETSYDMGALGAGLDFGTTYYWRVTVGGAGDLWSFTTADAVVINSAKGDAQPLGGTATLSVDAVSPVGAALTYQWHRLNFSPAPGIVLPDAPIPGAESSTLVVADLKVSDQGEYYCVVTSVDGEVASPNVFLDVQTGLIHRWTFDDSPDGIVVPDVVGDADGMLVNTTGLSAFADGQLTLGNNGSQGSNDGNGDFVDLPNGLVSSLTQMTIEVWTTWNLQTQGWARIYDMGTSNNGEGVSPGAGNAGVHDFYVTPKSGGNDADGNVLLEYRLGGNAPSIQPGGRMAAGEEVMVAQVTDDKSGRTKLFINGVVVGGFKPPFPLKDVVDNNVWLGRSQWPDPLYVGSYNDLRVYDTALSAQQIAADYLAGPTELGTLPAPYGGFALVGDLNGDGVYDFLDTAMQADKWLTDSLNKADQIADLQAQ